MHALLQDIRYGVRMFAKSPVFTIVAVVTLALGIGANTAIFSLVNALLFKPLPGVESPDRLVAVYTSDFSSSRFGTSSYPDYIDYRDQNEVFDGLVACRPLTAGLNAGESAERIPGEAVTGNYFSVLGSKAAIGRTLVAEDDSAANANAVAVVSYQSWKQLFGSDPDIVGKSISLNNHSFTIVGVAAEGFQGESLSTPVAVWIPLSAIGQIDAGVVRSDLFNRRGGRWLRILGRLKSGVTINQAQANIDLIAASLAEAYPRSNRGTLQQPDKPRPMTILPASDVAAVGPRARDTVERIAGILMAVVGFVLLIACANVANLLLARAGVRRKEVAIRLALGASRWRLVRQLFTESALLAFMGGAGGLLISFWMSDLFSLFDLPRGLDTSLDRRVLIFTLLVSIVTGILFGLAPALQASKPDLVSALKDSDATGGRPSRQFGLRNGLVVLQVALSLVLLIGAGLFLRSLQSAYSADLGFETRNAVVATVDLELQEYDEARGKAFYEQLQERVRALPGVESVALAAFLPVTNSGMRSNVTVEGYAPQPGEDTELNMNVVGPNYFQTLGIAFASGRDFAERDDENAPKVAIINEAMARHFWPDQDAVGKRISFRGPTGPFVEIVGVVRNGKYRALKEDPLSYIYLPLAQSYRSGLSVIARTTNDALALAPALRNEIRQLDKNLPVFDIKPLTQLVAEAVSQERMVATLLGVFGLLALLLSMVGIYGVMNYAVTRRRREIGIRMALGARPGSIMRLIITRGLILTISGIVVGLVAAFALTGVATSLLFGVSATDPITFVAIPLLLIGVALGASFVPARRAMKVDPMEALRYE